MINIELISICHIIHISCEVIYIFSVFFSVIVNNPVQLQVPFLLPVKEGKIKHRHRHLIMIVWIGLPLKGNPTSLL